MSEAAPTESFKPLRQEKPTEGGCILAFWHLSALASKWAVSKSLETLTWSPFYPSDIIYAKHFNKSDLKKHQSQNTGMPKFT